jgi:hypothetical protein
MRLVSCTLVFLAVAFLGIGWRGAEPACRAMRKGFPVVLLRQRTSPALHRQALSRRTTHIFRLLLFWGMILVWLLPWSPFLPQAIRRVTLKVLNTANGELPRGLRCFCFLVAVVITPVFQLFHAAGVLPALRYQGFAVAGPLAAWSRKRICAKTSHGPAGFPQRYFSSSVGDCGADFRTRPSIASASAELGWRIC